MEGNQIVKGGEGDFENYGKKARELRAQDAIVAAQECPATDSVFTSPWGHWMVKLRSRGFKGPNISTRLP